MLFTNATLDIKGGTLFVFFTIYKQIIRITMVIKIIQPYALFTIFSLSSMINVILKTTLQPASN